MFWSRSKFKRACTHRYLDMWAFMSLHPTNIELLQRLKKADDQRFGANMDVCGTVSERNISDDSWDSTHIVGIRSDIWHPNPEQRERILRKILEDREEWLRKKHQRTGKLSVAKEREFQLRLEKDRVMSTQPEEIENRRLVLKLFRTGTKRINWAGSIEEVVSREVHNSLGAKRTMLSFASSLERYEYMTLLQENNRLLRFPSTFSFSYYDDKQDRMCYLRIKRKWVSIGADYSIVGQNGIVGEIDGALIGLGYNAHILIYDEMLADDRRFVDLITLFATTVGYQSVLRRSVKRRIRAVRAGLSVQSAIEDEEFDLLRNPRSRGAA
ncbi:hypothetical protein AB1L42_21705 [Thalassoglobus sp. JC818]|uniref:hypothetical protein n=1 Tax=Thalassoglobus sp. JC818 TaxID=3232136 RepID=UPI003458F26B